MGEGSIAALKRAAEAVSIQYVENDAAHADLRDAKADLLDEVVQIIKPALRAITSIVKSDMTETQHSTPECRVVEHWFDWRGLRVASSGLKRDEGNTGGDYTGSSVYLRDDGTWAVVTYVGRWTLYQGGTCWWVATDGSKAQRRAHSDDPCGEEPVTFRVLTTRELVEENTIEGILFSIKEALEAQLEGNGPKRAKAAIARAAKVRAITELLK